MLKWKKHNKNWQYHSQEVSSAWQPAAMRDLCPVSGGMDQRTVLLDGHLDRQTDCSAFWNVQEAIITHLTHWKRIHPTIGLLYQSHQHKCQQATHTSSKMRFLALMIATLRALTHDSFSSGLTARNTRLGTCKKTKTLLFLVYDIDKVCFIWVGSSEHIIEWQIII